MKEVKFTAKARLLKAATRSAERVGVWTDGLMVSTEHEPGWPAALRLHTGRKYEVTVTVREVSSGESR